MSTVLVTGASGGIGGAAARLFADEGRSVILHYHKNEAAARTLAEKINAAAGHTRAAAVRADVSDEAQVKELFARAAELFSSVDILVNNAGAARAGLLTDMTAEEWDALFAVNVRGAFLCCKAALPHMIRKRSGCVVNVSSVWGMTGASCEVCYSAAKAALIGLTKALAKEVGPSGVRVNCVAPGVIDTPMNAALDDTCIEELRGAAALGTIGTTEDAAQSILFLASERARFITGQVLSPNGGLLI